MSGERGGEKEVIREVVKGEKDRLVSRKVVESNVALFGYFCS